MATLVYFYNALSEPKLISTSLKELKELKENIIINDSFRGDVTSEIKGIIRLWLKNGAKNINDLKEDLCDYDLFVNPEITDFQNKNKRVGLRLNDYLGRV